MGRAGRYLRSEIQGLVMDTMLSFGQRNFGNVDLGDKRSTKRIVQLVDLMCRHPGGTLPDKLSQPADLRAFYRLVDRPQTTHEALMRGHTAETRARIAAVGGGVVLILHDATELDYTSKTTLRDSLGQIGQGTHRGYICHNSLAVRADTGETLGLTAQILHHRADRPKNETNKQSRERENRESRLWLRGAQLSGTAPTGVLCVDVSDSLSDTFEYLAYEIDHHRHFVLRAKENRKLHTPVEGQNYLFDAARKLPPRGERKVEVPASAGRKARTATVQVSFAEVQLSPPGKKLGDYQQKPLTMWVVRVWEPNPPAGEEPLEWLLLTNVPVLVLEDALARIDWYKCRWIIEEYHKGMKTGCGIELMQFETIERLEPAIAVLSVVTTTLLRLRDAGRAPDADRRLATEVMDAEYVEVLASHYRTRMKPQPTIRSFYMHVARLGGHQNRKGDGFPGWITLWRGWQKLQAMVDGYRAAQRKTKTTCGKT
jgi:Transposase DNA-binding/Transposase Tn5 dimerisation domain